MMFAVLGYQHTNEEVLDALATARAHLDAGGLFAFDVWYGPAVLIERPSDRIQVVHAGPRQILRSASGTLNVRAHQCTVDYCVWTIEDDRILSQVSESHVMRYFFPLELEHLLASAGFSLVRLGSFPDFQVDASESTWNVLVIARAH